MLNRLFGALAVAVGVGAVVAVKLLKDQKETENKEVEDDDNEVHFITLSDGDGVAQPTYDASDRSLEVQEVCGVYPYLNPDFVEELLAEASSLNGMFEQDTLVTIHHYVSFDNEKNREAFCDIMTAAGYECAEEGITKKVFVEDGAIISDILNVANQASVLNGNYQNYSIQKQGQTSFHKKKVGVKASTFYTIL